MFRLRSRAWALGLVALTAVALAGCPGDDLSGPGIGVEVRVRNGSQRTMEDVVVAFPYPGGDMDYGTLVPGEVSDYRMVERAYRYAGIRVVVGGDTLGLVPVDYVGETPLSPGRYTYRLGLFEGRSLMLELE